MNMFFLFFKQKTAYEMRISDWSSDVCSSDLETGVAIEDRAGRRAKQEACAGLDADADIALPLKVETDARFRPRFLVEDEVADHRAQRVGASSAVDVAVGRERHLDRAAQRLSGFAGARIKTHDLLDLRRPARGPGRAHLLTRCGAVATPALPPPHFNTHPCATTP